MATCENQKAAAHAMPRGPPSVEDRRMTLEIRCDMDAQFTSTLKGVGSGTKRSGAATQSFALCDNHSEVFEQIDRELVEEGWAPFFIQKRPISP